MSAAHKRVSHHACPWVFSDEGVPQDLGQLAGSEWSVRFVPAQSSNTLLENEERRWYVYVWKSCYRGLATILFFSHIAHWISLKSIPVGCFPFTLSANRLLLISAPSRRVWRSALDVSAPLSLPARSIRENFPCILPRRRRMIWNTAWLREEWALAAVWPDVLEGGTRERVEVVLEDNLGTAPAVLSPAAVSHFDELQDVLGAFDFLLLQAHHLHLLLSILQHPQFSFAV